MWWDAFHFEEVLGLSNTKFSSSHEHLSKSIDFNSFSCLYGLNHIFISFMSGTMHVWWCQHMSSKERTNLSAYYFLYGRGRSLCIIVYGISRYLWMKFWLTFEKRHSGVYFDLLLILLFEFIFGIYKKIYIKIYEYVLQLIEHWWGTVSELWVAVCRCVYWRLLSVAIPLTNSLFDNLSLNA